MSYWMAGAAVGSAVIGASASNKASKGQQGAADAASALQQQQYGDTVARNQPFLNAGTDALAALQQKLPSLTTSYDPSKLKDDPGYQFGLQQGQQALERSLAARGRGVSGAALKGAAEFGNDYATGQVNSAFNRQLQGNQQSYNQLMGLTQLGQASANNTSAAGQSYANAAGANGIASADSAGANAIGQGNIFSGLINQGASIAGRSGSSGNSSPVYSYDQGSDGAGGYYSNEGRNSQQIIGRADGGPVRAEPRVGSRTPLPAASTGGGMSRDAILAALTDAHTKGQKPAAMPMNVPILGGNGSNPLVDARIQYAETHAAGGPIRGPGGPKDDAIHARLSDGEHVFDAEAVTALGDGDNEKGQALLNEMRQRIKAHNAGQKRKH